MTYTGNTSSDAAVWCWNSELDTLKRSVTAYKGWNTRRKNEIALLKKEQINLRMAYDNHVNGV